MTGPASKTCGAPAVGHFTWGADNTEGDLCAKHYNDLLARPEIRECINHTPLQHPASCTAAVS